MKGKRRLLPSGLIDDPVATKQRSLLRLLWVAYNRAVPPATLIENMALEHPGHYENKLKRLSMWLKADSPLGSALSHTPGVISEDDTLLIRCGADVASNEQALKFLIDHDHHPLVERSRPRIIHSIGYAILMLFIAMMILLFLGTFILPTLRQIVEELEIRPPAALMWLDWLINGLSGIWQLAIFLTMGFVFSLLFEDVRQFLKSRPIVRRLFHYSADEHAALLKLFAFPIGFQLSLAKTMTSAAQHHPNRTIRAKLLRVRNQSSDDAELWHSLARHRLIAPSEAQHLSQISDSGVLSWTLIQLANQKKTRTAFRRDRIIGVLQYLPVFFVAVPVIVSVLAIFMSLTSMVTL
ncbi:type II secretion system F family protein [Rhodopirellula sp. MGV]|uniref:type II secretion system F family protein n=1 Tax=Rhodopirellula sp. MGV TaxID=2023130 RepID=UPI00117AF1CE|nr:type II secretion system F family protein [Rhodopirellula sp. MGV]